MSFPRASAYQASILRFIPRIPRPIYGRNRPRLSADQKAYIECAGKLGEAPEARIDVDLRETLIEEQNQPPDAAAFDCGICWDTLHFPSITACDHAFCYVCIHQHLATLGPTCPGCRSLLKRPPTRDMVLEAELNEAIKSGLVGAQDEPTPVHPWYWQDITFSS
ncbi:hypothetical protein B0H11DRAFT_2241700 [Mycena galericulata]|nr:hypothetical protein B0H11DRAFT_2241700 [Mycena galericulata]